MWEQTAMDCWYPLEPVSRFPRVKRGNASAETNICSDQGYLKAGWRARCKNR